MKLSMWSAAFLTRFFLFLAVFAGSASAAARSLDAAAAMLPGTPNRCERVSIPMCKEMKYNLTKMPNSFGHERQEEAALEVHQFWPLTEINCSSEIKFFLCSMYAPICFRDYEGMVPPCRSVCERARSGCEPIMRNYGFTWPESMNCSKLPVYGDPVNLCMDPNETNLHHETGYSTTVAIGLTTQKPADVGKSTQPSDWEIKFDGNLIPEICHGSQCQCAPPFILLPENSPAYRRFRVANRSGCAIPCGEGVSPYFDSNEMRFAKFWILMWAVLCCVCTLVTVCTFLIDMSRFRYPERSIIFLSFCYFMVSLGYVVRWIVGQSVACDADLKTVRVGSGSAVCTIVFLLTYLFGMASSIWWVILSCTWFLAAGLKWSSEAISRYSGYFHTVAWTVSSVGAVTAVALGVIDGDPVTGMCYVGNTDVTMLWIFVLGPLLGCLGLGAAFLFAGFVSLFRIRSVVKQQQGKCASDVDKLEQLMVRIGIFSVLYTVPASIVVACCFYEAHYREVWELSSICRSCMRHKEWAKSIGYSPDFAIFMLRHFMFLIVGVTSGVWIWSRKTWASWRAFFRLCGGPRGATSQCKYYRAEKMIIRSQPELSCAGSSRFIQPPNHV